MQDLHIKNATPVDNTDSMRHIPLHSFREPQTTEPVVFWAQIKERAERVATMAEWVETMGDELERDNVCLTSLLDEPVHI